MNKEIVQLKHKILQQRISDILDVLKLMDKLIPCSNDIKSIEIISEQYEKMYQSVLQSQEYEKYEEVENTIIAKISKIEAQLDRKIYQISSQYKKYLDSIEESENYKNFHNLDIELKKLNSLKKFLVRCSPYHSQEQQNDLKEKIMDLRFKVLVRRQVEQMVYENHATRSWIAQCEDAELRYFISRVKKMIMSVNDKNDEILFAYDVREIMEDNILTSHLIFKLLEQDIEANPQKYMGLLQAPIFNPHLCNIASDSYGRVDLFMSLGRIDVPYGSELSKVNLSLLIGVLKNIIGEENTTIIECSNIYKRFGFECRPIVVTEGQEIIRQLFEKVKHTIKPKERNISETKGRLVCFHFKAYDYKFNPLEVPFHTNAQMRKCLVKDYCISYPTIYYYRYNDNRIEQQDLNLRNMRKMINERNELYKEMQIEENNWMQEPLEELEGTTQLQPAIPSFIELMTTRQKAYDAILWERYKLDFEKLQVRVEQIDKTIQISETGQIIFHVCINLDDIAELPIDYEKIVILTQDKEKGETFEAVQSLEDGQEH